MPPGFAEGSVVLPEAVRAMKWLLARHSWRSAKRELMHKPEPWRGALSSRTLYANYLAVKRRKGKGRLLPGTVPCVCLMHIFELLNRWKPNSLVAGENL